MQNKNFKNSIVSFILIVSTVLMPLSFLPKKAEAQIGIGGYASGLVPIITTLPQCKDVINSGISSLFNGINDLFSSIPTNDATEKALGLDLGSLAANKPDLSNLGSIASEAGDQFDSIKTSNPTLEKDIKEIKRDTKEVKASTASINANSTCIQSIGRLIIKMLLQKLTVSTVNWINSGFDGSPAFIQDPGKYFNDIAKNEILQFGLEINNPQLFPFGKAWMQNTAAAFNNKFQNNAQYSLDKIIQDTNPEFTAATFYQDFSQGGWNAWTAMTQIPANNPLGFKLMADNEIQKRLAGTTQSVAQNVRDALQQANGFLGDMRCVDSATGAPNGITQQQKSDALIAGEKDPCIEAGGNWEYVTPGSLVASAATTTMGYQNNAYLNVQDLNDAVAAVLDALLGQFSSDIMEKGYANIGDQGASGALVYDASNIDNPYRTQVEKDFMPAQLASSWLSANPNFNIRTDLTQALIDEQRTYSDKLALQNKELMSTTDGKKYTLSTDGKSSNAYGLMPVIYQLDFCIPGPHPGWEEDSRRALAAVTNLIIPETEQSLSNRTEAAILGAIKSFGPLAGAAIGASVGSAVPIVGTIIGAAVGAAVGFIVDLFASSDNAEKVRMYYSSQIRALTGYLPNFSRGNDDRTGNVSSKQGMLQVMDTILNRYAEIMNKTYFSSIEILPTVAKEATQSFNQLPGYGQMIKNNEDKIALLKNVVNILGEIKNAVNELNKRSDGGEITPTEYEDQLKTQINAFGRLSSNMVNGDDIASADNLLKQIKDKKDYIYKNLLKGPYSCEADLMKPQKNFPSANPGVQETNSDWSNFDALSVKRMTYPFPILYDYNKIVKESELPDPWGSGYKNTMPTDKNKDVYDTSGNNIYGPGFLGFVMFSAECACSNKDLRRGSERLTIHDLVPQEDNASSRYRAVGNREKIGAADDAADGGPFETMIGIY